MDTFREFDKLKERVKNSYQSLLPFREKRLDSIRAFIGSAYGSAPDVPEDTLINLVELHVNILLQNLISGEPRALVTTSKFALKTSATYFARAMNHVSKRIDLRSSLIGAITESLFSMGIVKIGVTTEYDDDAAGYLHEASLPFVDPVYFDDLVYDTRVPMWEQIAFCGNHYRQNKEDVDNDPRNDQTALQEISDDGTEWDIASGSDRAEELSGANTGFGAADDKDQYDLWDIWVPRQKKVITYAANGGNRPLRMVDWDGPVSGPYRRLAYNPVLNNIQPVPPIANSVEMADLYNKLWCKLGEQASRQKTVGVAHGSATQDAERVIRASDGQIINVTNPQSVNMIHFPGADQGTLGFASAVRDAWSYSNGNTDTMGGLASGAQTLGQEELLSNSSNNRIRSMQQNLLTFVRGIFEDIGWHIWNDPLIDLNLTSKVAGTDVEVESRWPRQQDDFGNEIDLRQGQYNDMNFEIDPFSMQDQTPSSKLAAIRSVVQQEVIPMLPMIMQKGGTFDVQEYLDCVSRLLNAPELNDFIKFTQPSEQEGNDQPVNLPSKPANTTRTYERVRGGGPTRGGMDKAMAMMGGSAAPKAGLQKAGA